MSIIRLYSNTYCLPATGQPFTLVQNARLPYGGQTGSGAAFGHGLVLGCVGGSPQSEIATLTVSTATGTLYCYFTTPGYVYTASFAYNASLATVKTAWEAVFGSGNVAVTGTPGTNYILTFQNNLANTRIGGLFSVSSSDASSSWARTQRGTSGAGQYDKYVQAGTNDCPTTASRILQFSYYADPQGGQWNPDTGPSNQPFQPPMYTTGVFNVEDLTGLDSSAMSDPGFRLFLGTAITETGAQIALGL